MIRGLVLCLSFAPWTPAPASVAVPTLRSPLEDHARLLGPTEKASVLQLLETLNASGRVQMAVFVTDSLGGQDIESYSLQVAEAWKLGKKGVDNGLLLVVAPRERRMRFEVGYGLEGDFPDIVAKRVLSDAMAPYFRANRYADGILVSIEAVARYLQIELTAPVDHRLRRRTTDPIGSLGFWILCLLFLLFFISRFFMTGMQPGWRSGGWGGGGGGFGGGGFGGGGFGGGGFGGGGGGFGGGGSSSSW